MKKLSVMLCLIALLAFTLNGCGGSGTTDTSYYGGGDSGSTTTTPTVTSCTTNLTPGQTCTINGSGFGGSRDSGLSSVSFVPQLTGGTTLTATTILTWSDTAVTCITPGVITGVQYVIVINRYTSSGTVSSSSTFVAGVNGTTGTAPSAAPAIASQAPNPATAGASVTLTGTNFPIGATGAYVLLNGTQVASVTWTVTTAVFTIPAGTATGASVIVGGGQGGASAAYSLVIGTTPTTPTITSISPNPVNAGSAITVNGTNLGTAGTFLIGTATVVPTGWTATAITATVPAAAAVGATTVTVTPTGATAVTSALTIAGATTPLLTVATPNTGAVGTTVLLTGTNLGAAGTITFGAIAATATAWAATSITTTVPTGATGVVTITVTPTGSTAATISFTVSGTAAASWHTAAAMDAGNDFANSPRVSFDRRAANATEGLLLYAEQTVSGGARQGLYCKRFTAAGWGTAKQIDTADGVNDPAEGQIASDANGNAIAVWTQIAASAGQNAFARRYDVATDSWGLATTIRNINCYALHTVCSTPKVAFNSNNDAVVGYNSKYNAAGAVGTAGSVWVRKIYGTVTDWATNSPFDGTMTCACLSTLTNNAQDFQLNRNGLLILGSFLQSNVATYNDVAYNVQTIVWDGRTWNAACWSGLKAMYAGANANGHREAFDSAGNVYAVCLTATNTVQAFKYQTAGDWYGVGVWNSGIILNTVNSAGTPVLGFDSGDAGLFVFQDAIGGRLLSRKYTGTAWVAGSFATAVYVDKSDYIATAGINVRNPEIAFNTTKSFGILVFLQADTNAPHWRALANVYTTSAGTYGGAAAIDANLAGNTLAPAIGCGTVNALAAFPEVSTVQRIYTNSYY